MVQITVVFDNKQTTLLNLIIVVVAMEKRFLFEYHACEHAAQTPQIQRIVIQLQT